MTSLNVAGSFLFTVRNFLIHYQITPSSPQRITAFGDKCQLLTSALNYMLQKDLQQLGRSMLQIKDHKIYNR